MGWIKRLFGRPKREPPVRGEKWTLTQRVEAADEVPDSLGPTEAVLVGTSRQPTWLIFDCPCGRGHRVMLNLHASRYPRWRIQTEAPLSVYPSIDDRTESRRCHFFIRDGHTIWARQTPPQE